MSSGCYFLYPKLSLNMEGNKIISVSLRPFVPFSWPTGSVRFEISSHRTYQPHVSGEYIFSPLLTHLVQTPVYLPLLRKPLPPSDRLVAPYQSTTGSNLQLVSMVTTENFDLKVDTAAAIYQTG